MRNPNRAKGRKLSLPGDPEIPKRSSIERVQGLYLKGTPELVDAIERVIVECGYKTVPEAIRHLLFVAVSATPMDGEFRAAMGAIRSQMIQYFTTRYWGKMQELISEFEVDWQRMNPNKKLEEEILKLRTGSENHG